MLIPSGRDLVIIYSVLDGTIEQPPLPMTHGIFHANDHYVVGIDQKQNIHFLKL